MDTVVILAAGEQVRWSGVALKQLAPVEGEPVIGRTVRQCQERGFVPQIVTIHPELQGLAHSIIPDRHACTCESLLSSQGFWEPTGRVVVLLGDVYYTASAFVRILNCESPLIRFFGNYAEIFAVVIPEQDRQRIVGRIERTIKERIPGNQRNAGKLWSLYRVCAGLPPNKHPKRSEWQPLHSLFEEVLDRTQDFDYMREWKKFVRETGKPEALPKVAALPDTASRM